MSKYHSLYELVSGLSVGDWLVLILAIGQTIKIIQKSEHPVVAYLRSWVEQKGPLWLLTLIECPWCLSVNIAFVMLWCFCWARWYPETYFASGVGLTVYTLAISRAVNLSYRSVLQLERRGLLLWRNKYD